MTAVLSIARQFERVIRYLLVGGGVTLFYTLLTIALISWALPSSPTLASAIASLVTLPVSFVVHRRVTYRDVSPEAAQWQRFAFVAAINFALNVGLMGASDRLGISYWAALAAGWILVPVANYVVTAIWVFRAKTLLRLDFPP